jgi:hypothetical protein
MLPHAAKTLTEMANPPSGAHPPSSTMPMATSIGSQSRGAGPKDTPPPGFAPDAALGGMANTAAMFDSPAPAGGAAPAAAALGGGFPCPQCGATLRPGAEFCRNCGAKISAA